MARVLLISHDVVGAAMAGPGIRALELARALAAEHAVTLAIPRPAEGLPPGVRGFVYAVGDAASLAPALAAADLVVAHGFALEAHPELAAAAAPLVLDMYNPTPLENLMLLREAAPEARAERSRRDIALLVQQLRAADALLCATERQRDLYLGALLAIGRVRPALADADPTLSGLLRVVPFGLPAEPPLPLPPPWPDLGADPRVILWTGGLWDWMDPLTPIRAMPQVLARIPNARLVFLAGQHPGLDVQMAMPGRARALAAELGLAAPAVTFVDRWLPYAERSGALLNAHLAIYLHTASLESRYAAVRSRFLDHLWAGLPSLVTAGDAGADLVARHDLGLVVEPGDVAGTARAMIALLGDEPYRQACAGRSRELAAAYTWQRVAAPLLDICRAPRRAPDRPLPEAPAPPPPPPPSAPLFTPAEVAERATRALAEDAPRNAALAEVAAGWHVAEPPIPAAGLLGRVRRRLIDALVRPVVAPLLARQNAFNAAAARALDALAASADARRSAHYATTDQAAGRVLDRLQTAEARLAALERWAAAHERSTDATLSRFRQELADARDRLTALDDADTLLAERIAELGAAERQSGGAAERGSGGEWM